MSLILLDKKFEKKREIGFRLILKGVLKVLRKKLMVSLKKIDGRNNTGRTVTYHRGGVVKEGIV